MKGTEKQIAYAESLREQYLNNIRQELSSQEKFIAQYTERAAADPSRDYSEKIHARAERAEFLRRKIAAVMAIEDAGECIEKMNARWFDLPWNFQ